MEKEHPSSAVPGRASKDTTPARRAAQAETEQCLRELDEERRRSDQFAHLVSHELRGPLTTLIGYAQLLSKGEDVRPALREQASRALLDQAKRMNYLVDNLLQASRLTSRRLRLERTPTDLVNLLRQVVEQQRPGLSHHRFLLTVPEQPIVGDWDSSLLTLALTNLISNAVKFSPEGGDVSITVRQGTDRAVVSVSDQGMGIAPEDLATLFQPYRRPSRTERFPGLGIGLHVAKGIVEAHGGEVAVQSKVDKGTTVTVTLSLAPQRE